MKKAMLLAAGMGSRLAPLTDIKPKPLVEVAGIPSVLVALTLLKEAGVGSLAVNLFRHGLMLEEFFTSHHYFGFDIHFCHEQELMNTGGGVYGCREYLDEEFFLINSDVYTDVNLSLINRAPALLLVNDDRKPVTLEKEIITGIAGVGNSPKNGTHQFSGISRLPVSVHEMTGPEKQSIVNTAFARMMREGELYGIPYNGVWYDTGTFEGLRRASVDLLLNDSLASRIYSATGFLRRAVDPNAAVHENAVVETSVVHAGARVEEGARLTRCLVLPGAVVKAGEELVDTVRLSG